MGSLAPALCRAVVNGLTATEMTLIKFIDNRF